MILNWPCKICSRCQEEVLRPIRWALSPFIFFSQFPIIRELTNLYQPTTGRRVKESIAEVVADLDKNLVQAIIEVTYAQGLNARDNSGLLHWGD